MTHDEIIAMAQEAGFLLYDMHDVNGVDLGESVEADDFAALNRFASLVAAKEREACAQVCDRYSKALDYGGHEYLRSKECELAAAVIRKRPD